jgi:hypothetical protein
MDSEILEATIITILAATTRRHKGLALECGVILILLEKISKSKYRKPECRSNSIRGAQRVRRRSQKGDFLPNAEIQHVPRVEILFFLYYDVYRTDNNVYSTVVC